MSWDWYEANADAVVPQYEAADPAALHAWLQDLLPSRGARHRRRQWPRRRLAGGARP
jgi:hypothetical protein